MKNMGKWFWAFVGVSVALVAAIVIAIVVGTPAKVPEIPEGPETGTYYFDADNGTEYLLELYDGNKFVLNDGVVRLGEYTVTETGLSFTFDKESNGAATATFADDVVTMDYNGAQIRFLRKVSYTVAFDTDGGSTVENATVVNGRPVAKPADPTKDGAVFVGWYTDAEFKTPYIFASSIITADSTLYARFVEKAIGQVEYEIVFEGADVDATTTRGGKVFGLPTPTKEGYTFGGWWTSDFNDAEKLTAQCVEGDALTGNTTLYALWLTTDKAPAVEVDETGVKWTAINGVASYAVKITDPTGSVVYDQNTGTTVLTFDFAVAGQYVVEVTAGAETTTRYYNAKALGKVSSFEVIDPSTLLFNAVPGAEKYYISIKCGNPAHNHEMIDNGSSNVYNFANCEMKEGGIEIVVTATARGYADSVSTTFVYEKKLDKVTQITVNAETDTLVWTPVNSATYYLVQVGEVVERVYGNTYSLKNFTGDLAIKVTPVTEGYLSPEAATHTYKKASLQAPTGLTINGMVVSWNAVEGATGYNVKVGSKVIAATGTTLDLSTADVSFMTGEAVRISVMATGTANSQYSDELVTYNQAFTDALIYKNGYVYWTPVVGSGNYEIKVNGGNSFIVADDVKAPIVFTQAGLHTIEVRFASKAYTSEWAKLDVMVYSVTFDVREGVAAGQLFVAADDILTLPTSTRTGYAFDGWYTTPSAAAGNGKLFDDETFGAKDNLVLYANWIANKYDIVFDIDEGITGVTNGDKTEVTFNQKFTLPVPSSEEGTFLGWFSGPGGSGYQVANAAGQSVRNYNVAGNTTVYPFFEIGTLTYIMQPDGTYAVKQGPNIRKVFDVIIPETYEGVPVTAVLENAFKSCQYIKTISIPNTVTLVGSGAFSGCRDLEAVNVRVIEGNHEVFYSSHDGALIRNDLGTTYLEYFPRSKSGEYTIPDGVDSILNKAFQYAYDLEVLNIGKDVTYIAEQAFFHCYELKEINFVAGGTKPLEIEDGAFLDVAKLKKITLPARLARLDSVATLDACKALVTINAEVGGEFFGSVDGMLTNGVRDTILYCPPMRQGALEIPVGITVIGDNAFANRTELTSLVVPAWVESIGANAFQNCSMIRTVEFVGGRNSNLTIGNNAFAGNKVLSSVSFPGGVTKDLGTVTIGDFAFANCDKLLTLVMNDNANIQSIGNSAFEGCSMGELRIAASIISVGDNAFANCDEMTTVEFAENCGDIQFGAAVFTGCNIRSVELPSTIQNFNGGVFQGCDTIAEIKVDPANPYLESVGGVLYNKGQTELLFYPQSKSVDFAALPATLTAIGPAAFQGNANLTEVVLPANITTIGDSAFEGCSNITSVTVQATENVKIGARAFSGCTALTTANIPACVKSLGDYVFYKTALADFQMPAALEYIGAFAFAETKLTTLDLPATLTTIGDGAFNKCAALTSVTIADPTEGEGAPLTIGVLTTEEYTATGAFRDCKALKTVNLPARIKFIGSRTFQQLSAITAVNIPDGAKLETIGDIAFYGLNKITSINLPEGLKTIGKQAFYGCNNAKLLTLTIPSTVEYIGYRAFYNTKFSTITFAPTPEGKVAVPLNIDNEAFFSNSNLVEVTLPARINTFFTWETTANGTRYPMLYKLFGYNTSNAKFKAIHIEEGNPQYMSIDGVVYEKDMAGNPSVLIYCPDGHTGTVRVPSTVVEVAYRAFNGFRSNGTMVTEIIFEEMENWDGTPTLSIGMTSNWATGDLTTTGAVFKSDKLTRIVFPKHLKEFNAASFNKLTKTGVSIEFAEGTKPVRIGAYAFYQNSGIAKLNLPPVSHLESNAFNNLSSLSTLTFGAGSTVTEIGDNMMSNCGNIRELVIPASVQRIGRYGISSSKLESLTFEEGSQLSYIAQYGISAGKMTSFVFPESVEMVEGPAFWTCYELQSITLNSSLKSPIGVNEKNILSGINKLEEIIVPEDNPYLKMVDGALYDKHMTTLYKVLRSAYEKTDANGKLIGVDFVIPSTVTAIEAYAFQYYNFDYDDGEPIYSNLTTIVIPEGVVKIGERAFTGCPSLTSMHFPATLESIGTYAFEYTRIAEFTFAAGSRLNNIDSYAFARAYNFTEFDIPDAVTFVPEDYDIFASCAKLTRVGLPTATTVIPNGMFASCSSLASITLHEGIEIIGYDAFEYCKSLTSIHIPASVEKMMSRTTGAFYSCTNLAEVTFAENSQLTDLGAGTFDGCFSLKSLTLPAGVALLNANVFNNCIALEYLELNGAWTEIPANYFKSNTALKTVVLAESAQIIGAGAFDGLTNLTSVTLPEELVTIGEAAFRNTGLTSIVIGPAVKNIGNYAFDGCTALESVIFDGANEITSLGDFPNVESAIFRGTTSLKSIELPSTIRTMGASVFEGSALESVALPTDLSAVSNAAFKNCVNLTYIAIPEFVAGIGDSAFEGCTALVTADVAEGVESIGSAAFRGCTNLTTTNVPKTIKKISGNPYVDCPNLSNFTFDPDNVAYTFEDGVMYDAGKFTLVFYSPANTAPAFTLPESVTGFADGAFNCSQLVEITLPNSLKEIPALLFSNSKKLESITIPAGVKKIGNEAFSGCAALTTVTIPADVTELGMGAFANATALTGLTFANPEAAITLGAHLFDGCTSLTSFTFPAGTTALADYLFAGTGITEITIPATFTSLDFEGVFANSALTTITFEKVAEEDEEGNLGEPVDHIVGNLGDKFFYNCKNLVTVDLPDGINSIGTFESVGQYSTSSNSLAPKHIYANDSSAFAGCTSLTSIDLVGIIVIGDNAFNGCTSLVDVQFPTGENTTAERKFLLMGDYVFANCTALETADMSGYYGNAPFLWNCPWKDNRLVWVNNSSIDLGEGKNYGTTNMSFECNIFENCTSLKTVAFPNGYLANVGTDLFVGCEALTQITNIHVDYFRLGATPFKGVSPEATIKFDIPTPALDDMDNVFYTVDDNDVEAPNHEWLKGVESTFYFQYSPLLGLEVGPDGLLTKVHVEYHDHQWGCPVCAPMRDPKANEELQGYLNLAAGESVADVELSGVVRSIESYDPETGAAVFTMYYMQFYNIPIVVEGVLAPNATASTPFVTGVNATVKGTVESADGAIRFKAGSEVTNISNIMPVYLIGNDLYAANIPTEVKGETRIRVPYTFQLERMDYWDGDYEGYYWDSDSDLVTFENVEEDGKMVTYIVIKPGATTQKVTISVCATYWGMIEYYDYFTITVKP